METLADDSSLRPHLRISGFGRGWDFLFLGFFYEWPLYNFNAGVLNGAHKWCSSSWGNSEFLEAQFRRFIFRDACVYRGVIFHRSAGDYKYRTRAPPLFLATPSCSYLEACATPRLHSLYCVSATPGRAEHPQPFSPVKGRYPPVLVCSFCSMQEGTSVSAGPGEGGGATPIQTPAGGGATVSVEGGSRGSSGLANLNERKRVLVASMSPEDVVSFVHWCSFFFVFLSFFGRLFIL